MAAFVASGALFTSRTKGRATSPRRGLYMTLMAPSTSTVAEVMQPNGKMKEVEVDTELDMRENLLNGKVDVYTFTKKFTNCGGGGACGNCKIRVLDGFQNMNARTTREEKVLEKAGAPDDIRLACRTRVSGPVSIETKPKF